MAEVREVTVRLSAKLLEKLERLADQAHESPDTYIESALAHVVRMASAARAQERLMRRLEQDGGDFEPPGYL